MIPQKRIEHICKIPTCHVYHGNQPTQEDGEHWECHDRDDEGGTLFQSMASAAPRGWEGHLWPLTHSLWLHLWHGQDWKVVWLTSYSYSPDRHQAHLYGWPATAQTDTRLTCMADQLQPRQTPGSPAWLTSYSPDRHQAHLYGWPATAQTDIRLTCMADQLQLQPRQTPGSPVWLTSYSPDRHQAHLYGWPATAQTDTRLTCMADQLQPRQTSGSPAWLTSYSPDRHQAHLYGWPATAQTSGSPVWLTSYSYSPDRHQAHLAQPTSCAPV